MLEIEFIFFIYYKMIKFCSSACSDSKEILLTNEESAEFEIPYNENNKKYLYKRKNLMIIGYITFTILLIFELYANIKVLEDNKLKEYITPDSIYNFKIYYGIVMGFKCLSNILLFLSIYYNKNYNISVVFVYASFILDTIFQPLFMIIPIRELITYTQYDDINDITLTIQFLFAGVLNNLNCVLLLQSTIIQSSYLYSEFNIQHFKYITHLINIVYIPILVIIFSILTNITEHWSFPVFLILYIAYLLTIMNKKHIIIDIILKLALFVCIADIIFYFDKDFWVVLIRFTLRLIYMSIFLRDIILSTSANYVSGLEEFTHTWHMSRNNNFELLQR
jgi:hypothetical protein